MAALALMLGVAGASAAEDNSEIRAPASGCGAFPPSDSDLPDLQALAVAVCEALGSAPAPEGPTRSDWRVHIGGWADASYRDDDGSGVDSSVAMNHLNVHVDARWRDRWQVFFETEYEYEPDLPGLEGETEVEIEQAYLQYEHRDWLHLRLGRFSTPFGYWVPAHWSINVDTIEEPIFEENRLVPEQQIGASAFGSFFHDDLGARDLQLDYTVYVAYATSGLDPGNPSGLTGGGDLRLRLADRYLIGTSFYAQQNEAEDDRTERSVVAYGQADLPWALTFRSEYVRQFRDGKAHPDYARDVGVFYVTLRRDLPWNTYLNYRFGYGDDDRFGFTDDHRAHTVTLGYRPLPRLRAKLEYSRHDFASPQNPDYDAWGAWLGVLF